MEYKINLTSPITIFNQDLHKYNYYVNYLNTYKYFIGKELYSLLLLYKFFLPCYFLRIIFRYYNFSNIFGPIVINNINNKEYNNTFVYLSEIEKIQNFVFTLSMIDRNTLNKIINDIMPIYKQIFI
jgi:hypothetical protein